MCLSSAPVIQAPAKPPPPPSVLEQAAPESANTQTDSKAANAAATGINKYRSSTGLGITSGSSSTGTGLGISM